MIHTFVVLAYKKSAYLENCIKSVLNQTVDSKVIIATTTDNQYIRNMAEKYKLEVKVGIHTNIGGDFDFAINCADTPLITVAHQDDEYKENYTEEVIKQYNTNSKITIIFTDYYEIRNNKKVYSNKNLKIKRFLLLPLRFKSMGKYKFFKRLVLRFGCSICCPAVTFVRKNCPKKIFTCELKCDVDWYAWEKLSKLDGYFIFISKKLMGHRVHEESTTSSILNDNIRENEDYNMFKKFWPAWIAKGLNKLYKKAEKSNNI